MVKEFRWHVQPFWHNTRVWQTDRQTRQTDGRTDRRTDGFGVAYTRYSIYAVARKNCWFLYIMYHRQNGSSSPVLTATCLSYGSLGDFIFFPNRPGGHIPRPILKQNGSNDVDSRTRAFWGKNCNFLKPLTLRSPKPPKFFTGAQ